MRSTVSLQLPQFRHVMIVVLSDEEHQIDQTHPTRDGTQPTAAAAPGSRKRDFDVGSPG